MIAMRAQLAPAMLLLLILLPSAAPLVPAALSPQEIRDRKINGANKLYIMSADPAAYAGEKKPAPESKEEVSTVGAGAELKPESKSDEKVLKAKVNPEVKKLRKEAAYDDAVAAEKTSAEVKPGSKSDEKVLKAKANAEVKQMRKEAAQDDAIAEEKAKEFKSKPKNTTDDAEDHAKEKKSKIKGDSSEDDEGAEKKSKSKLDYSGGEKKEKKSKNKDDDEEEKKSKSKSEDDDDDHDDEKKKKKKKEEEEEEKKSKSKDDDDDDDDEKKKKKKKKKKEKKSKSKDDDDDDDDDEKKKKKSKSKEEDDTEKESNEKGESSEDKSNSKGDDFDAVPVETKADESMPAADTPDGYAASTKKMPPYQAPATTMSATDSPDGYAAPTTMSAADTPDGEEVTQATPAMSASDSPDGYVPATYSPDGDVLASDSPDGYDSPSIIPKLNVQSFESMVPRPLLDILSPEVKSLCAKTRFPYTCETSIAKLPETTIVPARQKDGLGVLTLAVDAVRAKIAEARKAAKELAADPRMDKTAKTAINDCMAMYDDITTSYDTGMAALKRRDKATAATSFDAARTFVDTCDQGFLDRSAGLKPAIAGEEKMLAELSSNVLALNKYT